MIWPFGQNGNLPPHYSLVYGLMGLERMAHFSNARSISPPLFVLRVTGDKKFGFIIAQ